MAWTTKETLQLLKDQEERITELETALADALKRAEEAEKVILAADDLLNAWEGKRHWGFSITMLRKKTDEWKAAKEAWRKPINEAFYAQPTKEGQDDETKGR